VENSGEAGSAEVRNVEVRYAGVVVGRGALLKELGPDAAFVGLPEPLPVGTLVTLKIGDAVREARVDDVVESAEPTAVGMRIRWGGTAPVARPAPAPAPPTPAARPAPAPAPPAPAARPAPAPAPPTPAAPSAPAPAVSHAGETATATAATPDSGPPVAAEARDEGSAAIAAPLSLASPTGDGAQHGGGKRRRKRR
jgi:pyruvate dehydrogenase E2 component (dihydrolipoamide acetyltransferase)